MYNNDPSPAASRTNDPWAVPPNYCSRYDALFIRLMTSGEREERERERASEERGEERKRRESE